LGRGAPSRRRMLAALSCSEAFIEMGAITMLRENGSDNSRRRIRCVRE
jgi:hypothetical protein